MLKPYLPLVLLALACASPLSADGPILGFDAAGATAQRQLEQRFDAQLEADNLRRWMKRLAAKPHHVGSPHGKANAELMAELFRILGLRHPKIEEFQVLFPTPKTRARGDDRPDALSPPPSRRSPLGGDAAKAPEGTAALQRLLDRRRRHRRAGVRQPRRARRLRGARHGAGSASRAGSCWRATAARGAGSSPRWRPSTARSAASSTPTRATTATSSATSTPRAVTGRSTAPSAARSPTCRSSRAIR